MRRTLNWVLIVPNTLTQACINKERSSVGIRTNKKGFIESLIFAMTIVSVEFLGRLVFAMPTRTLERISFDLSL